MVSIKYDKGRLEANVRGIERFSSELSGKIYQATFDSALDVHAQAVRNAPYRTGNLRRSLTAAVGRARDTIVGAVGTNVVYGRIQEFGGRAGRKRSVKIMPKFYLTRSVEANRAKIQDRFKRYLAIKNV